MLKPASPTPITAIMLGQICLEAGCPPGVVNVLPGPGATIGAHLASHEGVDASDRHYLSEGFPVLIIWGARDPIIPVRHGERAHEAIPGSRLEILDGVGHLPQLEAPERFVAVLERFLQETDPGQFDAEQWRARFRPTADEP